MSRRKSQWRRNAIRAGSVDKILPRGTKGEGTWLTKMGSIDGRELGIPQPKATAGTTVTQPISSRKEQLVRNWCKF